MCGIAGFYEFVKLQEAETSYKKEVLAQMVDALSRRGPDASGTWLCERAGLAHARLSVIDLLGGSQPMVRSVAGNVVAIAYNGELYNTHELREALRARGQMFLTSSDTEVLLAGYLEYGIDFVTQLNGIFAFAIYNSRQQNLYLVRDQVGVKPLFFSKTEQELLFASEPKGIFASSSICPRVGKQGLNEIFSIGPARTPGCAVYEGMEEVLPGHILICTPDGISQKAYWKLTSHPHSDSLEETVKHVSFLVTDTIRRQMVSDVPICTFLSGGIDSSLVSAICAEELRKKGKQLTTFSFDFTGNDKNFQANAFQPSQDRPYVEEMVAFLQSDHHFLECSTNTQIERLNESVLAHDLPAMGDVDTSMLHFCSLVRQTHKVALTGECADEIFGGYPWFHRADCFETAAFPWSMDLAPRKWLLKDEFCEWLSMDSYAKETYEHSIAQTPRLDGENPTEARRREISWLNLRWFMQTLLNRMDRTSMYSGLEARVPFADHRIIEYLWNVPWEMKAKDGVAKYLLREAGAAHLPERIKNRKKSPYPKTYDREYEALLAKKVRELAEDSAAPVMQFLDQKKLETFLSSPSDYGKPWYGQLMAGPQMLAYLIQINFWLEHYGVRLEMH